MSNLTTKPATVRRSLLNRKSIASGLTTLVATCASGTQCPEVQASPVAAQALSALQKAVTAANTSLSSKEAAAVALSTSTKALSSNFKAVRTALTTYETAVAGLAGGSAAIITNAGLVVRDQSTPPAALTAVTVVHAKHGKRASEAIVTWPAAPGATGYALEANFTPQAAPATWTALPPGTGRRRIVKGPSAGAQFLVRVASLGRDGTQTDWSDAVMATAL
jgi:hypothetical protein